MPSVYCATTKLGSASIARASRSSAASLPSCPGFWLTAIWARANSSKALSERVGSEALSIRRASASVSVSFIVRAYTAGSGARRVSRSASGTVSGSRATGSLDGLFSSSSLGWMT